MLCMDKIHETHQLGLVGNLGHPQSNLGMRTKNMCLFFEPSAMNRTNELKHKARHKQFVNLKSSWVLPIASYGFPKILLWRQPPDQVSTGLLNFWAKHLGVDSPFFSAVVLFKNRSPFPQGFRWFSKTMRIPGLRMDMEGTT